MIVVGAQLRTFRGVPFLNLVAIPIPRVGDIARLFAMVGLAALAALAAEPGRASANLAGLRFHRPVSANLHAVLIVSVVLADEVALGISALSLVVLVITAVGAIAALLLAGVAVGFGVFAARRHAGAAAGRLRAGRAVALGVLLESVGNSLIREDVSGRAVGTVVGVSRVASATDMSVSASERHADQCRQTWTYWASIIFAVVRVGRLRKF